MRARANGGMMLALIAASAVAGPVTSSAQLVFIDPQTGQLEPPPADSTVQLTSLKKALSNSGDGLVETHVAGAAGGMMVDLRGRFRQALRATREDDGSVTADCIPAEPSDDKQ